MVTAKSTPRLLMVTAGDIPPSSWAYNLDAMLGDQMQGITIEPTDMSIDFTAARGRSAALRHAFIEGAPILVVASHEREHDAVSMVPLVSPLTRTALVSAASGDAPAFFWRVPRPDLFVASSVTDLAEVAMLLRGASLAAVGGFSASAAAFVPRIATKYCSWHFAALSAEFAQQHEAAIEHARAALDVRLEELALDLLLFSAMGAGKAEQWLPIVRDLQHRPDLIPSGDSDFIRLSFIEAARERIAKVFGGNAKRLDSLAQVLQHVRTG